MKLSGLGIAALLALAVFAVLAFVGSGTAQIVGFAGAVVVAIALVGGVPFRGGGASDGSMLASTERGRTITFAGHEVLDEAPVDEEAWRRERERRDGKTVEGASSQTPAQAYDPFRADGRS